MADSQEELREEFAEYEQAESALLSGSEYAPDREGGLPGWIKWMILADLVIIGAVLLIVFAA